MSHTHRTRSIRHKKRSKGVDSIVDETDYKDGLDIWRKRRNIVMKGILMHFSFKHKINPQYKPPTHQFKNSNLIVSRNKQ